MYDFHANIAILLNITPDHLDRYDFCMQNYVDAKMRIIQNQTSDDSSSTGTTTLSSSANSEVRHQGHTVSLL